MENTFMLCILIAIFDHNSLEFHIQCNAITWETEIEWTECLNMFKLKIII